MPQRQQNTIMNTDKKGQQQHQKELLQANNQEICWQLNLITMTTTMTIFQGGHWQLQQQYWHRQWEERQQQEQQQQKFCQRNRNTNDQIANRTKINENEDLGLVWQNVEIRYCQRIVHPGWTPLEMHQEKNILMVVWLWSLWIIWNGLFLLYFFTHIYFLYHSKYIVHYFLLFAIFCLLKLNAH